MRIALIVGTFISIGILGSLANSHELRQTKIIDSEEGRELLNYLVSCALKEGQKLIVKENQPLIGSVGLAPSWLKRALTKTEKRWISACVLARANFYGKPVRISMRSPLSTSDFNPSLLASKSEEREYRLFEGGFYGDIFDTSKAYFCKSPQFEENYTRIKKALRLCGKSTAHDSNVSHCGFIITGDCKNAGFEKSPDGRVWSEVVYVYLK